MDQMFWATPFNQNLSTWCVTNVQEEPYQFANDLEVSNRPVWGQCGELYLDDNGVTIKARDNAVIGEFYKLTNDGVEFKVVDVTMLREMVTNNEDITKVVTTKVTNMNSLFVESSFNGDISSWDVSGVIDMGGMFRKSLFNGDISSWDVSNVKYMNVMFEDNSFINQDLSGWNVNNVIQCYLFSNNTPQWSLPKPNFINCTN